jgi:hypothetical protein
MNIKEKIEKIIHQIGEKRIEGWIFLASIALFCDGIFEFVYFWFSGVYLAVFQKLTFLGIFYQHNFFIYCIWFTQVYSVLFIPLLVYLGYKYRFYRDKKLIKISFNLFLILIFGFFSYVNFTTSVYPLISEWILFFMIIYFILLKKFSVLFSFSFTYLMFFMANILFQIPENFSEGFAVVNSFLSVMLLIIVFLWVLHNLKFKVNLVVLIVFILIPISWVILPLSSSVGTILIWNNIMVRLITFPFFITIALKTAKLKYLNNL